MDTPDAQAETNETQTTEVDSQEVPSGLQTRINELTGQFRSLERSNSEKDQQILQLTNRLLDIQGQRNPQVDPLAEVLKDVDPDDMRRVGAIVNKQMAPLLERIDRLTNQLHETRANSALSGVADPAVKQRAQQLINGWRQKGVYGTVATDEDAILMAEAMVAREGRTGQNRAAAERDQFNQLTPGNTGGVRAAPTGQTKKARTPDLSGVSADELAERLRTNPALEDQFGDFEL